MKAYITIGLPGSGKSTWAKKFVQENPKTVRINNDEIRNKIYDRLGHRNWSKEIENKVKAERSAMILGCFMCGMDIIVDNTHCNKYAFEAIQKECSDLGFEVGIVDFTGVSADECIRRDSLREGHEQVGEAVIRRMEKQLEEIVNPKPKKVREKLPDMGTDPNLPLAIICDIDGTLAEMGNRSPYDESKVSLDNPRWFVIKTVNAIVKQYPNIKMFIFSGRTDSCKLRTIEWLDGVCNYQTEELGGSITLAMRKTGDRRRDSEVKRDLYNEFVKGKYNVLAVFDDRAQVIRELWAAENLPVFRCGVIDKDDF